MMRESNDADLNDFDEGATGGPPPTLISGKTAVWLVVIVGIVFAASGWLYIYDQKRVPREFWGFESPRIFVEAESVTALLLKPEAPGAAQKLPYHEELYLVDAARYVVVAKADISKRDDLHRLRHALVDHRNFDTTKKLWKDPEWRFGLIFENFHEESGAKYTSSIVFDSECMLGRPQSVEKTISTAPMSASLLAFFESVFPQAKEMPKTTPVAAMVDPAPTPVATKPAPNASDVILPPDADVITLQNANPSTQPSNAGISVRGPVVVPSVPQMPFVQGAPLTSGFAIPGSSPNPNTPGITLPPGNALQMPGSGPSRPNTFQFGPPLDLSTPRSVTVPTLEGGNPLGPSGGSGS